MLRHPQLFKQVFEKYQDKMAQRSNLSHLLSQRQLPKGIRIYPAGRLAFSHALEFSPGCFTRECSSGLKSALRAPESALEQQGESP
jgi:hypothetical protein